jgi:putative nucleotidyltransferase with HDIG domain
MMHNRTPLTRDEVIRQSRSLPSFPSLITQILATLDDPDGNLNTLMRCINLDPLISARILSVANSAAVRGRRDSEICDIRTATSLIGMSRVRHITLISSLSTFIAGNSPLRVPTSFWQHSVAVGICCEELTQQTQTSVTPATALVAGLLHDIGQLWLLHFKAAEFQVCQQQAKLRTLGIEEIEHEHFGIDHGTLGSWLVEHWALPSSVIEAIRHHHNPQSDLKSPLVALVHVAEVLSNALALCAGAENHVTQLSRQACEQLGLIWNPESRLLFGHIEARASHSNAFFAIAQPGVM